MKMHLKLTCSMKPFNLSCLLDRIIEVRKNKDSGGINNCNYKVLGGPRLESLEKTTTVDPEDINCQKNVIFEEF